MFKKIVLLAAAAFAAVSITACGGGDQATSTPSPSPTPAMAETDSATEGQAVGGQAYKMAMSNKLKANRYSGYTVEAEIEYGKFEIEAQVPVGKCKVEFKWVVGVLTAAEQASAVMKPGSTVKYKLQEVYHTKKRKMVTDTGLATVNPTPDEVKKYLGRGSACKP